MHFLAVGYPDQFDHAFKEAIRERAGALIVLPSVFYAHHLRHIAALARPNGLPAIFWSQQFAEVGGFMRRWRFFMVVELVPSGSVRRAAVLSSD